MPSTSSTTPFNDLIFDAEQSDPESAYDFSVTAYAVQADNVDSNAAQAWGLASSAPDTSSSGGNDGLISDGGTTP